MIARVKSYKKGFITSDSNVRPDATLADILELKRRTGHSTVAVTDDGTAHGKLLGIIGSAITVFAYEPGCACDRFYDAV